MTKQILEKITDAALAAGGRKFVIPAAGMMATVIIFSEASILIEASWKIYFQWPLYFAFLYNLWKWLDLKRSIKAAAKKVRSAYED